MNAGFTKHAAAVYCENGEWGKTEMKDTQLPLWAPALDGRIARQDLRVSPCEGGIAIVCLKQAISRLSVAAEGRGLPPLEPDKAFEAVCRLCDAERELLYGGGGAVVRLTVADSSAGLRPDGGENALLSVKMWYDPDPRDVGELTLEPRVDPVYGRYVEDPVFFRIGDRVAIPDRGVMCTLASELMGGWGVDGVQRRVSTDELKKAILEDTLREAFYADDIDGIFPVTGLYGHTLEEGKLTRKLADTLRSIESGAYSVPSLVTVI